MITDREYKHWITRRCERHNCWLVVAKLGDMISHTDTTIIGPDETVVAHKDLPLTHDTLEYVYLVNFTEDRLITLVQDKQFYYLIDNTEYVSEEGVKDHRSKILYDTSIKKLVGRMSGSLRKKIGLLHIDKIKLKQTERKQLEGVVPIDFICKPHPAQVKLFRDYVNQDTRRVDLSGLFILEPKVIEDAAVWGKKDFGHEEVVLYQNNRFHKFGWLKHFPNIKTLTLWYLNQVKDEDIELLVESAPNLNALEFHYCFQLTGRCIIPVSKLQHLDKLILNNERCELQELTYETVITDAEWTTISNTSLTLVLIDSQNLTLDFIDLFLKSFKVVQHFIMNEIVLEKLQKNSADGCKDREDPITFHSVKDTKVGFKRYRDVKIYDQVRNKCGNVFSDAMLNKIKQRSPEKSEIVDTLLSSL